MANHENLSPRGKNVTLDVALSDTWSTDSVGKSTY